MAEQLWERLRTIPGLHDWKESYPDVRFGELATSGGVQRFLDVLGWVAEKIRKYN